MYIRNPIPCIESIILHLLPIRSYSVAPFRCVFVFFCFSLLFLFFFLNNPPPPKTPPLPPPPPLPTPPPPPHRGRGRPNPPGGGGPPPRPGGGPRRSGVEARFSSPSGGAQHALDLFRIRGQGPRPAP